MAGVMQSIGEFRKNAKEHYKTQESCGFDDVLCRELKAISERRGEPIPACSDPDRKAEQASGDPIKDAHERNLFGLALSGGGIRSATFNLGVLEALARTKLLGKIDYVSTVSGGGYIGAWLTAWIRRDGQASVQRALGRENPPEDQDDKSKDEVSVDPYPITQLRRLSNYLTPKVGLFSPDTFVLVATYLRNLLLNLIVIALASTALVFLVRTLAKVFAALQRADLSVVYLMFIGFLFSVAGLITAKQLNGPHLAPPHDVDSDPINERGLFSRNAHVFVILSIAVGGGMFAQLNREIIGSEGLSILGTNVGKFLLVFWIVVSFLVFLRHLRAEAKVFKVFSKLLVLALILTVGVLTATFSYFVAVQLFELFSLERFQVYVPAFGGPLVLCGVYAVIVLFIGLGGRQLTEEQRQWLSRLGAWMIMYSLVWVGLLLLVQFGPILLSTDIFPSLSALTLFLTIWPTISAAGAYSGHRLEAYQEAAGVAKRLFMQATPYVFVVGLLLFNAFIVASTFGEVSSNYSLLNDGVSWAEDLGWCVGLIALAIIFSFRIDINEFSMHNFYKSRLVRAFLGASRVPRQPDPFTRFSRADDLLLSELRFRKRTKKNNYQGYDGPIPIISCALNLVGTRQLALQERKANSFMFSPYYFGFEYGSAEPKDVSKISRKKLFWSLRKPAYRLVDSYDREITVGESIATSGAAVSPNMGFRTTSGLAFLLTVFNIRLGAWMANPSVETRFRNYLTPKTAIGLLLMELFAQANERSRYVYLSDGGHFENLGIYELVRRRCRYIVASDAGADPQYAFADLSNAIQKVRADFGIDIDIDVSQIAPDSEGRSQSHYAVGLIHYDRVNKREQPGFLVYIKASLTGQEPTDILGFKKRHTTFPHQSTADQWFTETQFSSYRVLGRHIVEDTLRHGSKDSLSGVSLEEFFSQLRRAAYPESTKIREKFTGHAAELQRLLADLSADADLHFLDEQLFPESYCFKGDLDAREQGVPENTKQFRKGFYFCSRLIQLMENVFIDLNLDREYIHPDNRGWLNLFNHWTCGNMLRLTWALTAATYGARFQRFCEDHLEMSLGDIDAEEIPLAGRTLDEFTAEAFNTGVVSAREKQRLEMVAEKLGAHKAKSGSFWTFKMSVPIEATSGNEPPDEIKRFGRRHSIPCGFAITDTENRLVFLRIRDHLRGLGLARPILYALSKNLSAPIEMSPVARGLYEAIVRYPQRGRYFEILLHAIRSEHQTSRRAI